MGICHQSIPECTESITQILSLNKVEWTIEKSDSGKNVKLMVDGIEILVMPNHKRTTNPPPFDLDKLKKIDDTVGNESKNGSNIEKESDKKESSLIKFTNKTAGDTEFDFFCKNVISRLP